MEVYKMNVTPSREDYLIAVYLLKLEKEEVRSVDVAEFLGYTKPSVSNGLRYLREHNQMCIRDSITPFNCLSIHERLLNRSYNYTIDIRVQKIKRGSLFVSNRIINPSFWIKISKFFF